MNICIHMFFQFIIIGSTSAVADQVIRDILYLFVRDEGSLNTYRLWITGRIKEHIPFAEQLLCAVHVYDRP